MKKYFTPRNIISLIVFVLSSSAGAFYVILPYTIQTVLFVQKLNDAIVMIPEIKEEARKTNIEVTIIKQCLTDNGFTINDTRNIIGSNQDTTQDMVITQLTDEEKRKRGIAVNAATDYHNFWDKITE